MVAINTKFLATNCTLLRRDFGGQANGHEFGKLLNSQGPSADENPFRFSSEYFDQETGLVYYNFRYYSPELGKWMSRDPIGEEGGILLFNLQREIDDILSKIHYLKEEFIAFGNSFTHKLEINNEILDKSMEYYKEFCKISILYGFCSNNPISIYDINGLDCFDCLSRCIKANMFDPFMYSPVLLAEIPKKLVPPFRQVSPKQPGTTILSVIEHYTKPVTKRFLRVTGKAISKIATPLTIAEGLYNLEFEIACAILCCEDPSAY
jgi:RHS repeat-associated protein